MTERQIGANESQIGANDDTSAVPEGLRTFAIDFKSCGQRFDNLRELSIQLLITKNMLLLKIKRALSQKFQYYQIYLAVYDILFGNAFQ